MSDELDWNFSDKDDAKAEIRAAVEYLLKDVTGGTRGDIVQDCDRAPGRERITIGPARPLGRWLARGISRRPGIGEVRRLEATMIDPSYSRQRDQEDRAAVWARQRRMLIALVAAFILLGGGLSIVWGFGGVSSPAREQLPNQILETAKGLEVTQQQAVDQLQVVQDQLVAQQTETKKLSEQIAMLTEKLDALQQSVANIPAPSVAAPLPTPKVPPSKK